MADPAPPPYAVRVVITGRVQRVWFRSWTVQTATGLGLGGWVRNRSDGSVEALFAGPRPAVDEMVAACWQGSPNAEVTGVEATPAAPPDYADFRQLPTA